MRDQLRDTSHEDRSLLADYFFLPARRPKHILALASPKEHRPKPPKLKPKIEFAVNLKDENDDIQDVHHFDTFDEARAFVASLNACDEVSWDIERVTHQVSGCVTHRDLEEVDSGTFAKT